jgi:hypothetical protein
LSTRARKERKARGEKFVATPKVKGFVPSGPVAWSGVLAALQKAKEARNVRG